MSKSQSRPSRKNVKDRWDARLVEGAIWTANDNPVVHSTLEEPPTAAIGYRAARRIHKERMAADDTNYHVAALIHTCTDDQNFDGPRTGIWAKPEEFIEMARHFEGASVDLSLYADMPDPVMRGQVYRMRSLEYALASAGAGVVVNARWCGPETWSYTIDELPERSMLLVGTVGSGLKLLENRPVFEAGMRRILETKSPTGLIVIGSAASPVFDEAREQGVLVAQFDGETCAAFKATHRGKGGEADV